MKRYFKVEKVDFYKFRDELNIINEMNSELNRFVTTIINQQKDYFLVTIEGENSRVDRLISLSNYLDIEL